MLVITLRNDRTGIDSSSNYECVVYVNIKKIYGGRVEGHDRRAGWKNLIKMLAEELSDERDTTDTGEERTRGR